MTVKIYTLDENTVISGTAVDDAGTGYAQSAISKIRVVKRAPRNRTTLFAPILFDWTNPGNDADNSFQGILIDDLPIQGWWKLQFEFTLTNGNIVYSKKFKEYVGNNIIFSGAEVDGRIGSQVIASSLTLNGDLLLLDGNALVLN